VVDLGGVAGRVRTRRGLGGGRARGLAIPTKRFDKTTVSFLSAEEATALIDAPELQRWEGRRDRALLVLALQTGLRVSELISLDCADIVLGTGGHVRCEGKGRRQRAVPLTRSVQQVLRVWMTERDGRAEIRCFPPEQAGDSPDFRSS
jgi:site-specific recombinase XerD